MSRIVSFSTESTFSSRSSTFLQQSTVSSCIFQGTHNMDRTTYMPQSILHDILSRLPYKDAARTSVLSKDWNDIWSTFPFLVFVESRYQITEIPKDTNIQQREEALLLNKYKFCIWVSRTLLSFQHKGLNIRMFKLIFKSLPTPDMLSLVNNLIKLVCDSGVEILQLDNGVKVLRQENPRPLDLYDEFACLPLCVLEAKSLIKLSLSWYFRVDQAFLNHPIKFSSLQVLSLTHVYMGDEKVIHNIISSCPLIETLKLVHCSGLKSLSIHCLPKLKAVYIVGVEEVDVDAPSLEDLSYSTSGFEIDIPCKINMDNCTNLRELSLFYVSSIIITDQWFLELFKKFPLLERLVLEGFYMSEMINISSSQLKVLNLGNCYELEDIEIDAPNLYECVYHGDGSITPSIYILNSSSQLVLDIFFDNFLVDFENLRTFLDCISPEDIPVSLFLGFSDESAVEFEPFALQDYSMSPPSIKQLTIYAILDTEEWSLLLVSNLFWSCRPSIVSLKLDLNKTLVKIFCEKLIHRKEDDCCSSSQIKCWSHFLKDVKVSSSFRNHNAPDDLKTLLELFPILSSEEEEEIPRFKKGHLNFWLEW